MNISNLWNNIPDLLRPQQAGSGTVEGQGNRTAGADAAVPNGGKTDRADLSSSGLAAAQSVHLQDASDVRMDKVSSVRNAIQAGTYQVSAYDVAGKILQNMLD